MLWIKVKLRTIMTEAMMAVIWMMMTLETVIVVIVIGVIRPRGV